MDPFPSPVLKYLLKETLRNHRVAFLQVSPRGVLLGKGGWCPHFNLDYLTESHILVEELPFLEGLPFPPAHMILPAIQSPGRRAADVHLVPDEEQVWILFFDPEPTLEKHRQLQQRSNELSLLHEKQSKILDQYLGKLIASGLEQGVLQIKEEGERREITVLFADIRDFTAFSEKNPPGRVFNVLNKYLDSMIRLVLKQGGLIDNIIGDSIMAIFGIIPTVLSPQSHAVIAASEMIDAISRLNRSPLFSRNAGLQISVGIATGPAAIGVLGNKDRRTFSAIGHHVNLASRLESLARPKEIVIDKNTFNRIGDYRNYFTRSTHAFKGINHPVEIHTWRHH